MTIFSTFGKWPTWIFLIVKILRNKINEMLFSKWCWPPFCLIMLFFYRNNVDFGIDSPEFKTWIQSLIQSQYLIFQSKCSSTVCDKICETSSCLLISLIVHIFINNMEFCISSSVLPVRKVIHSIVWFRDAGMGYQLRCVRGAVLKQMNKMFWFENSLDKWRFL